MSRGSGKGLRPPIPGIFPPDSCLVETAVQGQNKNASSPADRGRVCHKQDRLSGRLRAKSVRD